MTWKTDSSILRLCYYRLHPFLVPVMRPLPFINIVITIPIDSYYHYFFSAWVIYFPQVVVSSFHFNEQDVKNPNFDNVIHSDFWYGKTRSGSALYERKRQGINEFNYVCQIQYSSLWHRKPGLRESGTTISGYYRAPQHQHQKSKKSAVGGETRRWLTSLWVVGIRSVALRSHSQNGKLGKSDHR